MTAIHDDVLNEDGTLRGVYYCAASGKRPQCLQVYMPNQEPGKRRRLLSMTLDRVDFEHQYETVVKRLAEAHGIAHSSPIYNAMAASQYAFVRKYGLKFYKVSYQQTYQPK